MKRLKTTKFYYYRKFVKNMTVKEVAELMNISESTVRNYDSGRLSVADMPYARVKQFAELFGCDADDLID